MLNNKFMQYVAYTTASDQHFQIELESCNDGRN